MAGLNMKGFRPVKFAFSQIHISGGHGAKPIPVTSKSVPETSGSNTTFVKMASNEVWLVFATTGQTKYTAGSFGRTSLLEELRDKVQQICDGEMSSSSGVAIARDDYDPMMEVEEEQGQDNIAPSKTKCQGQKRQRYYRNHARDSTVTVEMPVKCPEEDPKCKEVRKIRLYIADRKTIWLHIDDVEWAVRYLYVQNFLKGVPLVPDDSNGPE